MSLPDLPQQLLHKSSLVVAVGGIKSVTIYSIKKGKQYGTANTRNSLKSFLILSRWKRI